MSDCSIWLLPTFAKEVENYLTWTCSLRQSSGVYRKDLLLPSGGILFPFTPSKQFNWLSGCDSGMQGVFPRRGTHFNGTVHNPSHYSWIPSSFSMTDSHEQPQWLPLLSTQGICSIFSLMRSSARFRWFRELWCRCNQPLPGFKGVEELVLFPKNLPPAAVQLWGMWLQLTGTAGAVCSPGLSPREGDRLQGGHDVLIFSLSFLEGYALDKSHTEQSEGL